MAACAWELLGNWEMALYSFQLGIIAEDFAKESLLIEQQSETDSCWPHCKSAYLTYIAGDLPRAATILLETRKKFPFSDTCESPWLPTATQILFEHFLNVNDFARAEAYSRQILALSPNSDDILGGQHRQALLDFHMGKFTECAEKCHNLVAESTKKALPAHSVAFQLLLARCYLKTGNPDNALAHVLSAISQCERFVLHNLFADASMLLAEIHLCLSNTKAAQALIDRSVSSVITKGSVISRANLYLVWAKCVLSEESADHNKAVSYLDLAQNYAEKICCKQLMVEIYYLKAISFNHMHNLQSRNEAARNLREINKPSRVSQPISLNVTQELEKLATSKIS